MSLPLHQETVFGLPFVAASLCEAADYFVLKAQAGLDKPQLIAHADVHVLTRALHEAKDYGAGLAQFNFICPDGMPIVWMLRRKHKQSQRLYGPDMMEAMWDKGRAAGLRHFILGGSELAQEKACERLGARFDGASIAACYAPPYG